MAGYFHPCREREKAGLGKGYKLSKFIPEDVLPPVRLHGTLSMLGPRTGPI